MSETGMATTNTRLQGGNTPGHQQQEVTVAKEDLEIVAEWVKRDLFEKVKFLYNPQKDLAKFTRSSLEIARTGLLV